MSRAVLLPAAGASRRMRGRDKLLEDVGGKPCLRALAERALASSETVICALPALSHARAEALKGLDVMLLAVPDAASGMSASLRRGAEAAAGCELMILPADMPAIEAEHLAEMWEAFDALTKPAILQAATEAGEPGHPVIFSETYLPTFVSLEGDSGAAPILRQFAQVLHHHALPGSIARLDLDTPEDWAAWRRGRETHRG